MVSPDLMMPFFSADSIICSAILSLEEWPGLEASSLAKKVPGKPLVSLSILTIGVSPTSSNKLLKIFFLLFNKIEKDLEQYKNTRFFNGKINYRSQLSIILRRVLCFSSE